MKSLIQGFLTGTRGQARVLAPRQVISPRFSRHLNALREISPLWGRIPCLSIQVPPRTRFRIYSVTKPFPVAYTLHGHALSLRDIHIVTPRTPQATTHFSTLTFTGPRPARELALKRALPTTR